ncbi:TatD family hydrolase [Rheinheimera sp. 1928-s]|uniref:TatD family hydrolase n=1 Tax=Rheinheimera sp. 1928-s TaxID=3033803 RepID=UPI002611FEA1|nr:TatD family hydrolase [Rheinheimera sp. 1928-s]MDF3123999.1 TatD family hydrolase [Rheinheimera sp. 1928-s]
MSIVPPLQAADTRPVLFDSHCHLDLPELLPQLELHLANAKAVGVEGFLVPAVQSSAWLPLLALKQRYGFYIALGVHPWWASQSELEALSGLEALAALPEVNAIGEIGLDFALDEQSFALQRQCFELQLQLAGQLKKPVVLHHRKSQNELLQVIKQQQFSQGGILHAFSGSFAQGKAFIDMGFKLGIGGTITYERAEKTRKAVKQFPLDALVLETDSPSMPLHGFQGQINTPAQLPLVLKELAGLRGEDQQPIAQILFNTTVQLFPT